MVVALQVVDSTDTALIGVGVGVGVGGSAAADGSSGGSSSSSSTTTDNVMTECGGGGRDFDNDIILPLRGEERGPTSQSLRKDEGSTDDDDDDDHDDNGQHQEEEEEENQNQHDDYEEEDLIDHELSRPLPTPTRTPRGSVVSGSPSPPPAIIKTNSMTNNNGSNSKRQLLVRVGSWMKHSWRSRSSRSIASLSSAASFGDLRSNHQNGSMRNGSGHGGMNFDDDEEGNEDDEMAVKIPKHVQFEDETFLEIVIPDRPYGRNDYHDDDDGVHNGLLIEGNDDSFVDDNITNNDDDEERWFQDHDYKRFEKDRVLTVMGYEAMKRRAGNANTSMSTFEEEHHTTRGLEISVNQNWKKRQEGEKKDLYRAIKLEEKRQKDDGCFPNLERFRLVSRRHTKGSSDRAQQLGQDDAKAIGIKNSSGMGVRGNLFRRSSHSMKSR